ncbi:MAG: hypothetical protein HRU20_26210 [Pseudomonadales bacterium]|nr:hypothetical protein [Pseudomonadales bacterium]
MYPEWFDDAYLYEVHGSLAEQAQNACEVINSLIQTADVKVPNLAFLQWQVLAAKYREVLNRVLAYDVD